MVLLTLRHALNAPVSSAKIKENFYQILGWADADALIEKALNPNRTEKLPLEDVVGIETYVKEISPSYVYTRKISTKEPFTDKVFKAMTEDVKATACISFFGKTEKKESRQRATVGEYAHRDAQIINFARSEVRKNASTKKCASLNKTLYEYTKSVGQIRCGSVLGTCFLVADMQVITNYHIYRMILKERSKYPSHYFPIIVVFDYLYHDQDEHVLSVPVDESHDTTLENPHLDYKIFRLTPNEGLVGRVPLGPKVRNWQLNDGRVIILGHPGGKEMQDEVCVVVGYNKMHETIRKRHREFNGVHMTNGELLDNTEKYQGCLSYDTTFFCGASGSPVIEMNGNIVAMHTQNYHLTTEEDDHQEDIVSENIPNPGQQNAPGQRNTRTYSLMEFGVQFCVICNDIRRWHGEDVVRKIFPHYEMDPEFRFAYDVNLENPTKNEYFDKTFLDLEDNERKITAYQRPGNRRNQAG